MLDSDRLRNPALFDKIVSPEKAQELIQDGMNVGFSGFTPSGYPKKTTLALADAIRNGKKCRIAVWTGASVGPEIEQALAEVNGIASRAPYYAASNKALRKGINDGTIRYVDAHLSHFGPQVDFGFLGDVDAAVVEAAAITEDGDLILGSGVGNTPVFVKHAKKIIIEVNTSIPLSLEGMHDIYLCNKPPYRREIPIYHAADRIGSPYVKCGFDRIDAIVESDIPDHVRALTPPDEDSRKIARNLVDFLKNEQKHGRIPEQMLPIQSGVGSIANAVLGGLKESDLENLSMYSEILQDSVFDLIKMGKVTAASGCAFTPSPRVWEMYKKEPELYKKALVLRPLDVSNNPGIGGSGDYMRNGYLTFFCTPSTAKGGKISKVVPMVTHADHTEHDTMVFITEQGVADLRGLSPVERARCIIRNCAHPDYRGQLTEYLERSMLTGGHEPVDLAHCFDMELHFRKYGTMKLDEQA